MELKKYDLLIVKKSTSIMSRIVKMLLRSEYSHIAMYIGDFHIVDTDLMKKSAIRELNFKYDTYDVYRVKHELSKIQMKKIDNFILKNLNQDYDIVEALGIVLKRKIGEEDRYICISLVIEAFKEAGIIIDEKGQNFNDILNSKLFNRIK